MFFARSFGQAACNPFQTDPNAVDYCGGANYQPQTPTAVFPSQDSSQASLPPPPPPYPPAGAQVPPNYSDCPPGYQFYQGGCYNPVDLQQMRQGNYTRQGNSLVPSAPSASAPWYKNPLYIGLGLAGLAAVGGGVYFATRS